MYARLRGASPVERRPANLDPIICRRTLPKASKTLAECVYRNYRSSGLAPISGEDPILRSRSLLTQVLMINVLLIVATGLLATMAVNANAANLVKGRDLVVLGLALAATLL